MSKSISPIKPSEVSNHKVDIFPDFVFEVFNDCISANWNGEQSRVTLAEVRRELFARMEKEEQYSKISGAEKLKLIISWLSIEDVYRKEGWIVFFNSPVYDESFDAFFIFSKK